MDRSEGFAIYCNTDFNIIKVLRDDFSFVDKDLMNHTFLKLIEKSSLQRAFDFQKEINEHQVAFNWEMGLLLKDGIEVCYFTGVKDNDKIVIIATKDYQDFNQFYEEYQAIFNEQINLLRGSEKEKTEVKKTDVDANIFNEFSRINNELTDLQRELSKKNVLMEKQQKQLELINSILRHDLANHFSVIRSAVRLYEREPNQEFLDEVVKHSLSGVELIKNMKQLESVFASNVQTSNYPIKNVVEKVAYNYPDIEFEINLETAEVQANSSLESVIDNIIRNAIKHGGTDKIKLTSEKTEQRYILKITDFGKGIPDEIKPKIFDENFKSGSTGNTGLGLFIVKQMMNNYGGNVHVEDNVPQGAIFVLDFRIGGN
ncbi:MAG: HAMP domain-containing histidine kinase [Candidatus Cloacimonetes bacterium]|nr:HAMP domain-containing histidine kinase [Candidatus Cloacimonadota bacterium]MCF7867466.1 HAMP domain-containing histidine kinase [Candidatus Cloacimonadota bacterium]MCF7882902.1 HAMP domain-containing histidine kinase [Candidatus Cloacimonadota bacterium]